MVGRRQNCGGAVVREVIFVRKIEIALGFTGSKNFNAGERILRKHLERPEE